MGCECAKNNLENDDNELTKDPMARNKNANKQQEVLKGGNSFFDSLKPEGVIQIDDDQVSNCKSALMSSRIITNYNQKILAVINSIRSNPPGFAQKIEDSMCNIQLINDKLIYKSKVKVILARGRPAFEEAANILRQTEKMLPLKIKNDIIIPLPETKEQLKDINYFKSKAHEIQKKVSIEVYFRDLVKNPETSALLMIVDDIEKNPGKKRGAILNPLFKNVGISSIFIDQSFIAYFSFSK